jgi:hypothetical protein
MSDAYQPELGQMMFGQPSHALSVPVDVELALDAISNAASVYCGFGAFESPFSNSGARYEWSCFAVHAYDWGDDQSQQWNFKWRDFEVSWYKYLGRGMSRNRKISKAELQEMLTECLTALMTEKPAQND